MNTFSRNTISFCIVFVTLVLTFQLYATEILVKNAKELREKTDKSSAGDIIYLAKEGNWNDVKLRISASNLTIAAEIIGETSFTGKSSLEVTGDNLTLRGLTFKEGCLEKGHILWVKGNHCRITQCSFIEYNPPKTSTRYHWLTLHGHHHRVDHCLFKGQNHSGTAVCVRLDGEDVGHHRIDHNYFLDRAKSYENGFEMIRIGDSQTSMTYANCIVTKNLFEACDGEIEMISNKSCGNVYHANSIIRCAGCLTLRHGNDCTVSHNIIIGEGKKGTGGIRVIGENHKVINNFINGTDGRVDGAIAISAGVNNPKLNQHNQVKNLLVADNRLFDNRGGSFCIGHGMGSKDRTLEPVNVTFRNNLETPGKPEDYAYLLTRNDVGPNSTQPIRNDSTLNTHAVGDVDNFENTAWNVPSPKSQPGITMDETDAKLIGEWQYSTHTPSWVGAGYLHDQKKGKGEKSIVWTFEPPKTGKYRVEVSHCYNVRRATNTPVTIVHSEGETTVKINQQEMPTVQRLFRPLGEFRFEKGNKGSVTISNEGTDPKKVVIADAVRFIPLAD